MSFGGDISKYSNVIRNPTIPLFTTRSSSRSLILNVGLFIGSNIIHARQFDS
jgi:hypothetical protein